MSLLISAWAFSDNKFKFTYFYNYNFTIILEKNIADGVVAYIDNFIDNFNLIY